ncbi:hypothetical protein HanRHA438_Chr16g0770621 [Helianthus annuus]|nr:hypothetical protein HanRHA438_Chr16g0770621 [Helianthus annuus]
MREHTNIQVTLYSPSMTESFRSSDSQIQTCVRICLFCKKMRFKLILTKNGVKLLTGTPTWLKPILEVWCHSGNYDPNHCKKKKKQKKKKQCNALKHGIWFSFYVWLWYKQRPLSYIVLMYGNFAKDGGSTPSRSCPSRILFIKQNSTS